jgi:thiol-disulfide isomerase/thioredoxin
MADPQLELYVDGKRIKEYNDDRNYDFLSKWINDEAVAYARTIVLGSGEDTTTESEPYRHPNPEGKVVEVDAKELQKFKDEGPVFIKFYAPWCTQ